MRAALEDLVPDGPSGRLSSIASGVASGVWKFASPSGRDAAAAADDRLLARERQNNKLLAALHGFGTLQGMLLRAAEATPPAGTALHVLLPQSVTLDDVAITAELVQTHVVFLQNAVPRGAPRAFTSLNGLCGSCEADGSIIVRRRLPHGARAPHAPPVEGGGGDCRARHVSLPLPRRRLGPRRAPASRRGGRSPIVAARCRDRVVGT